MMKRFSYIDVKSGDDFVATETFANIDAVVATEFKKDLPAIQTRAIASAIIKTLTQYKLKEEYGAVGDIFAIFQAVTTGSDTRMWTLPKNIQVAKVAMPKDGVLELKFGYNTQQIENRRGK